jgi:hypothetical protein
MEEQNEIERLEEERRRLDKSAALAHRRRLGRILRAMPETDTAVSRKLRVLVTTAVAGAVRADRPPGYKTKRKDS